MRHLCGIRPLHQVLGYRLQSMASAAMENAPAREKRLKKASFSLAFNKDSLNW
jgi:hypothetical protein